MPTQPYKLKDGSRVPGTTTIISNCNLGSVDGLLYWANQLGRDGKSHTEVRDKAADAGTACHEMCECFAKGTDFDGSKYPAEILAKAEGAFNAFRSWARQTNLRIAQSELPLVSEQWRYGGTLDCMLVNGELALGDYKTSNSIRVGMLCQLAAYHNLWTENRPEEPITGGFHLLRFSKPEHADDPVHFSHHHWSHLDAAWDAFKHMRELYELHKRLKAIL